MLSRKVRKLERSRRRPNHWSSEELGDEGRNGEDAPVSLRIPSDSMHELWPSVCGPCASIVWQHSEWKCCKPQYGGFVRVTRWVRAGQLCSKSATSPPKLLLLGLCCKKNSVSETEPTTNLVGRLFSFQSEDFPDELNLPKDIPFRQPPHLAFPDHVQNLIALNRPPASIERSKALAGWSSVVCRSLLTRKDSRSGAGLS